MGGKGQIGTISGPLPTQLANELSQLLARHLATPANPRGLEVDAACSVAAMVIADYGRRFYGDAYLDHLAAAFLARKGAPLPQFEELAAPARKGTRPN